MFQRPSLFPDVPTMVGLQLTRVGRAPARVYLEKKACVVWKDDATGSTFAVAQQTLLCQSQDRNSYVETQDPLGGLEEEKPRLCARMVKADSNAATLESRAYVACANCSACSHAHPRC